MPPQPPPPEPAPSYASWLIWSCGIVLFLIIVSALAYFLFWNILPAQPPTPYSQETSVNKETKIYYSPQTKSLFVYSIDASTTQKVHLDAHGFEAEVITPSSLDALVLTVPEFVSLFHASTTASGKVIFTLLTSSTTKAYLYDPLTTIVRPINTTSADTMSVPRLSNVSDDETKLMFSSNGCYRCGAGYPYISITDLKTDKSAYIGRVIAFEWLEENKYRYKERIHDATRDADPECESLGCSIAANKLEWIYGEL